MSKHIRVITPIISDLRALSDFDSFQGPALTVTTTRLETGPASIECEFEEALAVPGVVARAIEAQNDGADAVVIDCMGDPGLNAAREVVTIPVLGPCQTALHLAAISGHKFGVVTVLERLEPLFDNMAATYGLTSKYAGLRAVDIPVLELEQDMERLTHALVEQAIRSVVEDRAHVVVLGCTGMLGCAEAVRAGLLEAGLDVPVIDPVPATIWTAAAFIDMGLSHSKHSHQPPPEKPIAGYEFPSLNV